MHRGNIRFIILIVVYVFYLAVGAAIFSSIEGPYERMLFKKVRLARDEFLAQNPCINDEDLERFIEQVVAVKEQGISPLANASERPSWGFGSSLFFAGTVITTIGYGNLAPLSSGGKVFCIVFALFGIPMTAIMLSAIVERLMLITDLVERFLRERFTLKGVAPSYLHFFHLCLIMFVIILLVLFLPALIFMFLEDWNYFEAFYFCFISLTTIGLGDFVPGDASSWIKSEYHELYKSSCVLFFILGLSSLILVLELCAKIPDDHPGMLFSCHQPFLGGDEDGTQLTSIPGNKMSAKTNSPVVAKGTNGKHTYKRLVEAGAEE